MTGWKRPFYVSVVISKFSPNESAKQQNQSPPKKIVGADKGGVGLASEPTIRSASAQFLRVSDPLISRAMKCRLTIGHL